MTAQQLRARLLALSPRAFELFAGDLLAFMGLRTVAVTRYVGDGGIDADGELEVAGTLISIPTGIQVKRKRANVGRPEIDQFLGALNNRYAHGIFITTAGYAPQARAKAASALPRIATIDGTHVIGLMQRYGLGIADAGGLDEAYFVQFEALAGGGRGRIAEHAEPYTNGDSATLLRPEDDLITLRALSHALRVDTTALRRALEAGRLVPDQIGAVSGYFFRRDRIPAIRTALLGTTPPAHPDAWRQEFLRFAQSRNLTKSYKPVLLLALLQGVDRHGEVAINTLVAGFRAFYLERRAAGLPVEFGPPDPCTLSDAALRQLIRKHPLERFVIQGFLEYDAGIVRFAPQLWHELRVWELLDVQQAAHEQLRYYYARGE